MIKSVVIAVVSASVIGTLFMMGAKPQDLVVPGCLISVFVASCVTCLYGKGTK